MAKFSGGTFKDGVLSYVYEAKPGGRKNNINIKQINGEWFFVNKDGKVRDKLANKGKLSKTHIDNLKGAPGSSEENIFASANVSPETGKVATNVDTSGGIDTTPQGSLSDPIPQQNTLANSNYSLPQTELPVSDAQRDFNPVTRDTSIPANREGIANNAPGVYSAPAQTMPVNPASDGTFTSNFPDRSGMGIGENVYSAPAQIGTQQWERAGNMSLTSDPSSVVTAPSQNLTGQNEFTGFGKENMSGPGWGAPSTPIAQPSGNLATQGTSEWGDKGYISEQAMTKAAEGGFNPESAVDYGQFTRGPVSQAATDRLEAAAAPGVTVEKDNPWGAADWSAVGSVMKGVGGLASAYTGIKNYQLARDAFGAQKDKWQADYNQRLKAYEDNKALANQEIDAKNRVLAARGQGSNVIKHI